MSIKKTITIIAVVVVILFAIPIGLFFTIDINSYKSQISDAVQQSTGRKLEIKGRLQRSLFPKLGLTVMDTQLGNPPGFGEQSFLDISKLNIYIQVMPLFKKKLVVDTIVLEGLLVNLRQSASGKNNWTFTQADTDKPKITPSDKTKGIARDVSAPPTLAGLSIAGVNIVDARINFQDDITNNTVNAEKLNLQLSAIKPDQPIGLELHGHVRNQQPSLDADIALTTTISLNMTAQRYQAEIKKLSVTARGDLIPNKQQSIDLNANVSFDGKSQLVDISQLTLSQGDLKINGKLQQTSATPNRFQGQIKIEPFNLNKKLQALAIPLPEKLPDKALRRLDLLADFQIDTDQASLPKLVINLDDSKVTGKLEKFVFATQHTEWALHLDQINLDQYLPASAKDTQSDKKTTMPETTNTEPQALLPVELLRDINMDGQIKVGKLIAQNIPTENIQIGIKANKGDIKIRPLKLAIYSGNMNGQVTLDVRENSPKLFVKQKIADLLLGELLTDTLQIDQLSAKTISDISFDINTVGNDIKSWTENLHGQAQFRLKNGALTNINLVKNILEKYMKFTKKTVDITKHTNQTVFDSVTGTLQIDKGIVKNKDLKAQSYEVDVTGKGKVDLPKMRIDYIANVLLKHTSALKGKAIPIPIKGPLADPEIGILDGLRTVLGAMARESIDREKEKLKQQAKEKADAEKQRLKEKAKEEEQRLREKIEKEKQRAKDQLKEKLKCLF